MKIKVLTNLLKANDAIAQANRKTFEQNRVFVINLMGAPGAGKTTILEKTLAELSQRYRIGVIEGDICTDRDSRRLEPHAAQIVQINTDAFGGQCHLDANMIKGALERLNLRELDLLFIENVGNLVCPAEFNVGEDAKAMVLSATEGDDKPRKYPLMFRVSRLLLLNKTDLLEHTNFDRDRFRTEVCDVNPQMEILEICARSGEGMQAWYRWIEGQLRRKYR